MYTQYRQQILDETAALGLLQYMTPDQLRRYMDDDNAVVEYIADNDQMKNIEGEKVTTITSNRSIAEYNMQREPQLRRAREYLAETYKNAVQIQRQVENNKLKLDSNTCTQTAEDMLPILQTEAVKAEEDAENVIEKFLKKEVDVDRFIDEFIAKKILANTRKVKSEKLKEMLSHMQNGHVTQPAQQQWAANFGSQWQPYPMQMPDARRFLPP